METIDRINLLLAERGMTGAELSRELGLSNSTYSLWNTRKSNPGKSTIKLIAEYFDVPVAYLLGQQERPVPTSENGSDYLQDEINRLVGLMSDRDRGVMLATAQALIAARQ